MSIFSRYLVRRFLSILILALSCSIVIFLVINFVENTRIWLARPRQEVFEYYVNFIPHIFYLVLPIAILLAAVFSVGNMARHLEIVAMKASGVSVFRILLPLVLLGSLISVGMFYFGDTVLPDSNYKRFKIQEPGTPESQEGRPGEKYKFVYIGPQNTTYFFQHYSGIRRRGRDVTILMARGDTLYQRFDCREMYWENHWVLSKGTMRRFEGGRVIAESFETRPMLDLIDTPEDLVNTRIFPDEMRTSVLKRRISILKRSGEPTRRFETQWHFKYSGCAVNIIMMLIGISLAVNTHRSSLTKRFGISLLAAFLYFILLKFGLVLGENGEVSPVMGAWLGNAVFGAMGLIMFGKAAFR